MVTPTLGYSTVVARFDHQYAHVAGIHRVPLSSTAPYTVDLKANNQYR
jgi:hypothetical protein